MRARFAFIYGAPPHPVPTTSATVYGGGRYGGFAVILEV